MSVFVPKKYLRFCQKLLLVWLALCLGSAAIAQLPPAIGINSDQVLVLKNGKILRGIVTKKPLQYIIQIENSSRLVIARENVSFVCDSMAEAYIEKLADINATDTAAQTKLFHWCMTHKMLRQAENQIQLLIHSDIKPADLAFLNRQLNLALKRGEHKPADRRVAKKLQAPLSNPLSPLQGKTKTPKTSPPASTVAFSPLPTLDQPNPSPPPANSIASTPTASSIGTSDPSAWSGNTASQIRQVQHTQPATEASYQQVIRDIRALAPGTTQKYRQTLEPFLTKSCGNAGCHTPKANVMPILKSGLRLNSISMSRRNLHNMLPYIDMANLENSSLWTATLGNHAGVEEPFFDTSSSESRALVNWLTSLNSSRSQPNFYGLKNKQKDPLFQPLTPKRPDQAATQLSTIGEIPKLNQKGVRQTNGFLPVDPFDPEIFNRKHHDK